MTDMPNRPEFHDVVKARITPLVKDLVEAIDDTGEAEDPVNALRSALPAVGIMGNVEATNLVWAARAFLRASASACEAFATVGDPDGNATLGFAAIRAADEALNLLQLAGLASKAEARGH